jgi:hypothetical protein
VTKPIRGYVDGLEGRFIVGWAVYESDDTACLVTVSTPDGREVGRAHASHPREDLRNIANGRVNFAFRIAVDYPPDAEALHVTFDDVLLPGSPLAVGRGMFDGGFTVQSGVIVGAVTERAANALPPRIRVEEQYGRVVAEGLASLSRPNRIRTALPSPISALRCVRSASGSTNSTFALRPMSSRRDLICPE